MVDTETTMVTVIEEGLEKAQMNETGGTKGVGQKGVGDQGSQRGRGWKALKEDGMIDVIGSAHGLLREDTIKSIA